ncbi:uncharacterized protein LOC8277663 [Ricinus communis]|uniref:uncharacterized protein LOC8277663 n=1 Tax=Ricinus communis TaxID=3988 RepID=UPI000772BC27|nr:uncharacterized protein LOC8277663 [Ricinus communis]|eukprot:XP_015583560.1 uncharacterized protein LOC8277663 [Ricinus communis]
MSTTLLQISILFSPLNLNTLHDDVCKKPISFHSPSHSKIASFNRKRFKLSAFREKWSLFEVGRGRGGILVQDEGWKRRKRIVLVRFNQGFGFGGGGGGRDNSETVRLLGNVALAIGLTYLSMTGQLGWVFDAIGWVLDIVISIWVLAVLIPIVGLGAFLWWAGRDILQGTCPNCGNDFQIFKSTLNDELQLCPYCSQPFSVVGDEFVSDSVKFSNRSTAFGEAFRDFSSGSKKGKESSSAVVDVEAEIKDAD